VVCSGFQHGSGGNGIGSYCGNLNIGKFPFDGGDKLLAKTAALGINDQKIHILILYPLNLH
jgi:hypothetical protein